MNFFSIKWKISISFVVFSLGFIGMYVYLASGVFQHDKLSYVFETQQKQVESLAQNFSNSVDRALVGSRAIMLGYNTQTHKLLPTAGRFFKDEKSIEAIELTRGTSAPPIFALEKSPGLLKSLGTVGTARNVKGVQLAHWHDDYFVMTITEFNEDQDPIQARVILHLDGLLDDAIEGQTLALTDKSQVISISESSKLGRSEVEKFLTSSKGDLPDGTSMHEMAKEDQLISVASMPLGGFSVMAILSEGVAMSALQELYSRSVIFILFSVFATVFISLILSFSLTRNINSLTVAAERLGKGDFSHIPENGARDEVGVLTKAFQRMILEIQRLLKDTAEKSRMEQELKTARLVQESLFPEKQDAQLKNLSLSGFYATSSECGGDWWYYYVTGDNVTIAVADATGHGTPAALVTSAARSLFSYVERADLSIKEVATHWNEAIAVCSKQRVFMTAILARINTVTGVGSYINAGHEPPILFNKEGDKYSSEFLISAQNATLGDRGTLQWSEGHFQISPGSRFLIYTDGLLAFKSPEGQTVGEKRFLRAVDKISLAQPTTRGFVEEIFKHFDKFGGNQTLPDDVTFVVVDNIAPVT